MKSINIMNTGNMVDIIWLVVSIPLKNICQLGLLFPIYGQLKFMFQTTNQIFMANYDILI